MFHIDTLICSKDVSYFDIIIFSKRGYTVQYIYTGYTVYIYTGYTQMHVFYSLFSLKRIIFNKQ